MLPSSGKASPDRPKPLKRGKACVNCRFYKIKCDGVKPICGPCMKNPKDDPCAYTDKDSSRSLVKSLVEETEKLKDRIRELENPQHAAPSMTLHQPYPTISTPSVQLSSSTPSDSFNLSIPFSPSSSLSTPPLLFGAFLSTTSPSRQLERMDSAASERASSASSYAESVEEPSPHVIRNLIDQFLPHASQFGFFLDPARFRHSALLDLPFGHSSRPSPALLCTVYLLGVHLSCADSASVPLEVFLKRALRHTSYELSSMTLHPHLVVHTMQAEVLLAHYYLCNARFFEAKAHATLAVTIALCARLNRVRSPFQVIPPVFGVLMSSPVVPPPPLDASAEGERINGFWAVFVLHKTMAVALDPPTSVCGALEASGAWIDSPWPQEVENYPIGVLPPTVPSNFTVRDYMSERPQIDPNVFSLPAMQVKGALLLHRAAHLAGSWRPQLSPGDYRAFTTAFQALDRLGQQFRIDISRLPPPQQQPISPGSDTALGHNSPGPSPIASGSGMHSGLSMSSGLHGGTSPLTPFSEASGSFSGSPGGAGAGGARRGPDVREYVLTLALVEAATIKLHKQFAHSDIASKRKCLSAAHAIVNLGKTYLSQGPGGHVNPLLGLLWTIGCQFLVDEISRLRAQEGSLTPTNSISASDTLVQALHDGMRTLEQYAPLNPYISYSLAMLQAAWNSVNMPAY